MKLKMYHILETTNVILVYSNIFNNDCQHESSALSTDVLNKSFSQLLDISPKNFKFLKNFNSEFSYIEAYLQIKILSGYR